MMLHSWNLSIWKVKVTGSGVESECENRKFQASLSTRRTGGTIKEEEKEIHRKMKREIPVSDKPSSETSKSLKQFGSF